jgi:DnaK suppressor protein
VPDSQTLSSLRAELEAERAQLAGQLADQGLAFDGNFADSGQVAAERGENRVMVNQMRDSLAEVDLALAKMNEGRYGLCERCGREISEPRLEAMPATRWCIEHASSH